MANCPNCGSGHIQLKQETDVNWGGAIAGYALFGVVGAAIGAVTGEDRNVNACLDCGTSWKAEDLFKLLQIIKDCTGAELNLAIYHDRVYMNNFISEVGSYLKEIPEIEKKADQLIADRKKEAEKKAFPGCSAIGCLFFIFGIPAITSIGGAAFLIILLIFIVGFIIDMIFMAANQKAIEEAVENAKEQAVSMKREAEKKLNAKIQSFMENNPL
ncbi:hypothetical protein PN480_07395 [Dolichospermum circinale CS-1225]|uniref:hypothetical protein n=1 Tax=Dolichospermum circinale TaxID=109265 RepID=UPI000414951A|nr:hypothetical protein [Dolichospermum circinale]MDB9456826.1 hypothetical protein [Dolichospermum circinale CS-545/17]MDB9521776.1 hypothetical protein [Dolichospermum circinale CS-1225]